MQPFYLLLSSIAAFNGILYSFLYYIHQDAHPWHLLAQITLPLLVWEFLLIAAFLPEEYIGIEGDEEFFSVTDDSARSIRRQRIRPSGDYFSDRSFVTEADSLSQ